MVRAEWLAGVPVFVTAAEAGSFAAAAVTLHLSRSAVAKTIARLEARIGAQLFHRSTRTLALTEDGQVFLEHCRRALAEMQAGQALIDTGRRSVSGRLRVSMPVLFGRQCVAPILTALAAVHRELALELNFSDRIVSLVDDGFDLAIRNGALPSSPGLKVRHLVRQHMCVCASPSYLAARSSPASLDDLGMHVAVVYGKGEHTLPWQFRRGPAAVDSVTPPHRLRLDDLGAIRDAVRAGHGLGWLPRWLVGDDIAEGRLVLVMAELPSHIADTYAVWPETSHLARRVRVAIDTLVERLPAVIRPLSA